MKSATISYHPIRGGTLLPGKVLETLTDHYVTYDELAAARREDQATSMIGYSCIEMQMVDRYSSTEPTAILKQSYDLMDREQLEKLQLWCDSFEGISFALVKENRTGNKYQGFQSEYKVLGVLRVTPLLR